MPLNSRRLPHSPASSRSASSLQLLWVFDDQVICEDAAFSTGGAWWVDFQSPATRVNTPYFRRWFFSKYVFAC